MQSVPAGPPNTAQRPPCTPLFFGPDAVNVDVQAAVGHGPPEWIQPEPGARHQEVVMPSKEEIQQEPGDREHALGVTEPGKTDKDTDEDSDQPLDEDLPTGHLEATPETD